MNSIVTRNLNDLSRICSRRRVRRLALFGSATDEAFDPTTSDLDLLVDFKPMSPAEHAEQYFGLMEDLFDLFGVAIDLVESGPIRNPYFLQAVKDTQELLFEAA